MLYLDWRFFPVFDQVDPMTAYGGVYHADLVALSVVVGAVLMGAGIGLMHYSGMAAMRPEAVLRYDPGLVGVSVVVAVALAFLSLSIRFSFHRFHQSSVLATVVAAPVMGFAVAGMH